MLAALLWEGALRAGFTRTNRTSRADRCSRGRGEIQRIGVDELIGMRDHAAKPHCEFFARGAKGLHLALHMPCNPQVRVPIGHGGNLPGNAVRGFKGAVNRPQWAGAASVRKMKRRSGLAFGNIASAVSADKDKRYTARTGALKRR